MNTSSTLSATNSAGRWTLYGVPKSRRALTCCRAAGLWNAPSGGWDAIGVWRAMRMWWRGKQFSPQTCWRAKCRSILKRTFAKVRVNLFPTSRNDVETECSCPDWSNPCKHIAAVYLLLGEQFDADPFLLFRLRGKDKNEIMELLRARRSAGKPVLARDAARKKKKRAGRVPTEKIAPLENLVNVFWVADDTLNDFRVNVCAAEVDAAPVKRLGAPGFWHGKQEFIPLIERAYREIAHAALDLVRL